MLKARNYSKLNEIRINNIYFLFLGSIPFGFLLTKIFLKKILGKIGSGNIGATNAIRTGNKLIGYSTLILDILKAVIPVIFVKIYFIEYLYITCTMCLFRSCFSSLVKVLKAAKVLQHMLEFYVV